MLNLERVHLDLKNFSLKEISFHVNKGDYLVVLGESGVGKTLLLEIIAGLHSLDSGKIILEGKDITREKIQKRGVGLVYQDQALFPHLTVRENIGYGVRTADEKVLLDKLIHEIEISTLLDRRPETLSGGEAQRVALIRSLAIHPSLLLLDEPLSALDAGSRSDMRRLLRKLNHNGQTILHVTHDYEEALSLASHIAVMEEGCLVQVGEPREIFQHPKSEFVARFIGVRNFFEGELISGQEHEKEVAKFLTQGLTISVLTVAPSSFGFLMLRSEDIVLSHSRLDSSAINVFQGTVMDIDSSYLGVEVSVDFGVRIVTRISKESWDRLGLQIGKQAWVSFKASACRFIPKEDF